MDNEGAPDSTLIREVTGAKVDTVVFVGYGAIDGGWLPLRSALDAWIVGDQSVSGDVTSLRRRNSEAFHQLAILSFKFKIARGLHFTRLRRQSPSAGHKKTTSRWLHGL
jgi:hypothetical protein